MLRLLKSLLGESPRKSTNKPASRASSTPTRSGGDYRAVSIDSATDCHAAVKDSNATRYLLREAPRLPLANCTMPATCRCRFRKHADRRDGDRRLLGTTETTRWFVGSERRKRTGRRAMAH